MIESIQQAPPAARKAPLCRALKIARATYYRRRATPGLDARPSASGLAPKRVSHRALSASERQTVLETLHSPRFADKAPHQIYAALLDEELTRGLITVLSQVRILPGPPLSLLFF